MPEYKLTVEDKDALAALNRIDKRLEDLAGNASRSFSKTGDSATASGVKIGAVAGVVQELTRRFIELGERAAAAFAQAVIGGIKLNEQAELTGIALTNIFEGNSEAAQAFLGTIDETAALLGANRQGFRTLGKSLLPDVGNIDDTVKILKEAVVLGRDAGANLESVRIALEESLSSGGSAQGLNSLRRRLNIPPETIRRIQELSKEIGIGAALAQALGERTEKAGISADNFAETFTVAMGNLNSELTDMQTLLGEAGFEEAKNQINAILEAFDANRDDIEKVVEAFGDLAAKVIEIVGSGITDFLNDADYEGLETLGDNFTKLLNTAETLIDVLSSEDAFTNLIDGSNEFLVNLTDILETITKITGEGKAGRARNAAEAAVFADNLEGSAAPGLGRDLAKVLGPEITIGTGRLAAQLAGDTELLEKARVAGEKAYQEALSGTTDALKGLEDANQAVDDAAAARGQTEEKNTAAAKAQGDAILAEKAAFEALTEAESNAAEARDKIEGELAEQKKEYNRKLTEQLIKDGRKLIEDEIKNSEKREDIARKNADKITDIYRKQQQRLDDAATDLTRNDEDIARDAARKRIELEQDSAGKRIDIERNYRQELRRIQRSFEQAAQDAERNNDAQAFLEAVRRRDASIEDAKGSRKEEIESAKIDAKDRREELKQQLEYEREDAQIANQRKLEDLQLTLDRELEAQQIAFQRDLDEQTIAEQRQAEERRRQQAQELEDIRRHNEEKLADLQESLEKEFEVVKALETAKADYAIAQAKRAAEAVKSIYSGKPSDKEQAGGYEGINTSRTRSSSGSNGYLGINPNRHSGGPVQGGQTYATLPGEYLMTPQQSGYIVPGPGLSAGLAGGTTNIDNSRSIGAVTVPDSLAQNGMLERMIKNRIYEVLGSLG